MMLTNLDQTANNLLSQVSGKTTPARVNVLNILLSSPTALNHQNIEQIAKEAGLSIDKVTLYRTLDWLVEKRVAHRIASVNRAWYFNASPQPEATPHAHFHCKICTQIYCLEDMNSMPLSNLPKQYKLEEAELSLQGQCVSCAKDH